MGNYKQLKQAIANVIKTNGNQEITGAILQNALLSIISTIGTDATFAGIATPTTNPGTPDQNVFYLSSVKGVYSNFNGENVLDETILFFNKNGSWESVKTGIGTREKILELEQFYHNFNLEPSNEINSYEIINGKYVNNEGEEVERQNFGYIKLENIDDIYAISVKTITGVDSPILLWMDENNNIINKIETPYNNFYAAVDSIKPLNAKKLISNVYQGSKNITIKKLIFKDTPLSEELQQNVKKVVDGYNGVKNISEVEQKYNADYFGSVPIYTIDGKYYKNINGDIGDIGSFCIERYIIPKEATKLNVTKATIGTAYSLFRDCYGNILGGVDNIAEEIQIPQNSIFIDFSYIKRNGIDFAFDVEYNILEQYLLSLQNQIGYGNFYKTKVILENQYYSSPTGSITELQNFRIQKIEIPFGAEKIDIKYLNSGSAYNLIRDVYGNIIDYKTGKLSGTEWELSKKSYLLEICYSKNNEMEISFIPKSGIVEKIEKLENRYNPNYWEGKKICIIGTSVAFGALANVSYVQNAAKALGANIICAAIPGLAIHCKKNESNIYYPINRAGSSVLSKNEYETAKENGLTDIVIPTEPIPTWNPWGQSNRFYATWENIFSEENRDVDLWVFATIPNNTDFSKTDWDLFKKPDVETAYDVTQWGYTDDTTFEEHRTTFLGAMLYLIDKMYKLNENARMVLVIDSPFQYKNGKEAFQLLYETFGIPVVDLWGKMQWTTPAKKILLSDNGTDRHPSAFAQEKMGIIMSNELLMIK